MRGRIIALGLVIASFPAHAEPGGDGIAAAMEALGINDAIDAAFGVEADDDAGGDDD